MKLYRSIIYIIFGLAAIGLFSQLFTNPLGIIKWLFFMAVFAAIIITVINLFIRRSNPTTSNEMKKYRQAVKQSKQRYQQKPRKHKPKSINRKKRRRRPTHLRVIQGEKSKNKKHATFE